MKKGMNVDIRHFITFKTIVKMGSYTAAGVELGYTQSAITEHMRRLESSLNTKLFDHIGRKMVLTQTGYELLKYTDELMLIMEKIDSVGVDADDLQGTVRVAMPGDLAFGRFCWALKKFREIAPKVNIIINSEHSVTKIYQLLRNGDVDIAFTMDHGKEHHQFHVTRMEDTSLCIIAGPTVNITKVNLKSYGNPLGLGIVLNQRDSVFRGIFEDYLERRNIVPESITELWGIEVVKRYVHFGAGITMLPHVNIENELKKGKFILLETDVPLPKIYINMSVLKNKWESPQIKLFKQVVQKYYGSQYPALEHISNFY